MDYGKYYEAREIVKKIMKQDLLGPLYEDEIISGYPMTYYVTGKLYPKNSNSSVELDPTEDVREMDEEPQISLDHGNQPASMGISFTLTGTAKEFFVSVKAALYEPVETSGEKEEEPKGPEGEKDREENKNRWKRKKVELPEKAIQVAELLEHKRIIVPVDEYLEIVFLLHKVYSDQSMSVTATLMNNHPYCQNRAETNKCTYFQPEIRIHGERTAFSDVRKNITLARNAEVQEMELLYSAYRNYVAGHGCAANCIEKGNEILLYTTFLPEYELNPMMPAQKSEYKIFSMNYLAQAEKTTLLKELKSWLEDYHDWIEGQTQKAKTVKIEYRDSANGNIKKCNETYMTIRRAIDCLEDDVVFKAFRYANEAMFMQRKQMLENKGIQVVKESIKWYPFQLAFFLQEIVSFADPHSEMRKKVDLLWFPTGGGKTEAYLGIAAFVIFLRRMRHERSGAGVSIIMRYTLRLLTFQQFERATAMICACELLRKKYGIAGPEISIGLWAGKALTPNTIEKASSILDGDKDPDCESSNPMQLEKCPWCGSSLERDNYHCSIEHQRMLISCSNPDCDFRQGLPVYLIDEEIYRYRPNFLVATVDKFAQVPLREETFSLFGKNSESLPPELIIQDELHLISGPLGSITGIYETAFQKMCTYQNINAKVIASTATIRNAAEQIRELYAADYTQFPPQGLDVDDSYFAVKSSNLQKPSRLYMGCMGAGASPTVVMVRVMAVTLFATRYLESLGYDDEIIDSFWTITSYFNTLKELGNAITRILDIVQDYWIYLKETKFKKEYPIVGGQTRYDHYIELTSREKSENIGRIIQNELLIKYSKKKEVMPYDFILASNMISVGIDIARLNTMLLVGQPKTTAEYIQATSRVGRETPGFVFTIYSGLKARDKSHFEQFCQYHEAFYKYVEATSVTPFAERARDRALQTLYVVLCRYYIDVLTENDSAGKFRRDLPGLGKIRYYILNHVELVDPEEYENVEDELNEIELEWELQALEHADLVYQKRSGTTGPALFKESYQEGERFRVLNSMRSVEPSVQVITRE